MPSCDKEAHSNGANVRKWGISAEPRRSRIGAQAAFPIHIAPDLIGVPLFLGSIVITGSLVLHLMKYSGAPDQVRADERSFVEQPAQVSRAVEDAHDLHFVGQVEEEDQLTPQPCGAQTGGEIIAGRKTFGTFRSLCSLVLQFRNETEGAIWIVLRNICCDGPQILKGSGQIGKPLHALAARRSATRASSSA